MSRRLLTLLASVLALLALWPLMQLLSQGVQGLQQGLVHLGPMADVRSAALSCCCSAVPWGAR
jgi:hypothetical protein